MADNKTTKAYSGVIEHQLFRVGDWQVSPETCTVSQVSADGKLLQETKVTPRSMDVLRLLIDNAGQVVSPGEFLDNIWRSPIATDHAVHKAIAELRGALLDSAHKPAYIKTIPKRGYTLIAPVISITTSSSPEHSPQDQAAAQPAAPVSGMLPARQSPTARTAQSNTNLARQRADRSFRWRLLVAASLIAAVVLGPMLYQNKEIRSAADGVVSLVVLPFAARDYSDENQILAEGIRESLIHGLSKISHLQVISPPRGVELPRTYSSSDQSAYLKQTDHILQGSVMTSGDRMRVIVQLIKADTGLREYSDQFDLPLDDIFAVQDQIVDNVVGALRIYLNDSERTQMRDWGTTNPLAYERFLRGEFYNNQFNPADWLRAMAYHRAAIELDPDFLNAYHGLATAANNLAVYSGTERINELFLTVLDVHRQISRINPDSPILDSIHAIKLRMRGSSYLQQETQLREQILSGQPPHFAIAHYALLLIGARLYDEAARFLDTASEAGPYEISPDEVWSYRHNVLPPADSVVARKQQLQQRPFHVSYLGSVAINLAVLGDFRQAQIYLNQQKEVDDEGILAHYTESVMGFLAGTIRADDHSYLAAMRDHPDFYYNNGVLAFLAGDIETGAWYWQNLPTVHLRRLFNVTHAAEKLFPDEVLAAPEYLAVLESLGAGTTWQQRLIEGVMAMESVTGVAPSRKALDAYQNQQMLIRNNLWSEQQWSEYDHHRSSRLGSASTLSAIRVH
jgi:TolB-like protein/DNA-binding winged helix-turn-helix (wHTH) protein